MNTSVTVRWQPEMGASEGRGRDLLQGCTEARQQERQLLREAITDATNSISVRCQESLVQQAKWNVLPVAQSRALGACWLLAVLCPGSASAWLPPSPNPLPSSLLSPQSSCPVRAL